ncbi:MAG: MBL fold metallo-hydrolase [Ferruginibacter sp.]|nr:MBL fold metallo-hydrolase [Ferruginibacter sp.]
MALEVCSLNSGSNGNCYYIGNDQHGVLIDAGLSCKETEKRLHQSNLSIKKIRCIIISHEHTDHIRGLEKLVLRHSIPVYITQPTYKVSRLNLPESYIRDFSTYSSFMVEDLEIIPIKKSHDATDPYSFVIKSNNVAVGVFTDIGKVSENLQQSFSLCNAVFLESNYDYEMLKNGPYPIHLQKRICGGSGHLSNLQALSLLEQHASPFLTHVFLSHLSEKNNHPDIVMDTFSRFTKKMDISIASRYGASEVYRILGSQEFVLKNFKRKMIQMKMFD